MGFTLKYQISQRYLTKPSKRRSGILISPDVKFLVAHDTGNPGSSASGNVRYYERSRNEMSASAHIFVDDREIIECIPALESSPPEKAWHVLYYLPTDDQLFGYNANDAAIGVEYCYGGRIDDDEAYRKYVWVLAYACYKNDLDLQRCVVGHFFLDPRRKTDPVTGLAYNRRSYDQLLRDVVSEYEICTGPTTPSPAPERSLPQKSGTVTTTVRLNIRKGVPNTRAPIYQVVQSGTKLTYVGVIEDGELVNGNPIWYADDSGNFFWSGGAA
jgi:N-acetylmuramoyl-L-alanine amidase CwlA